MNNLNYNLLEFSEEITNLYIIIEKWSLENLNLKYYKNEDNKLLSNSVECNNKMAGNILSFLLSDNCTSNRGTKK